MTRRSHRILRGAILLVIATFASLASPHALSQSYPSKLVRIVVTASAGAPADIFARFAAEQLRERFNQPFVVEGRFGAGGALGMEAVAKSSPDGHTLLITFDSPLVISPRVYANFAVDPLRDLAPVATLGDGGVQVLVVGAEVPVNTLAEFVEYARARPGALSYASGGYGTPSNLLSEIFKGQAKLDVLHVPFNKPPTAVANEVIAGRVTMYFALPASILGHIRSGALRALATAGGTRSSLLPDVPTFAESGYPAFAPPGTWFALLAPARTPADIIETLNAEIGRIVRMPKMRELLAAQGVEPVSLSPAEIAERLRRETEYWSGVVRTLGVKAQ